MIFTTWALGRYQGEIQTYLSTNPNTNYLNSSEQFSTAGRSIKTGLVGKNLCAKVTVLKWVAAAVVSSWTWAATLLHSSGFAYRYGGSGPVCISCCLCADMPGYASGATVQILLFAVLAIELKRRAPSAHTFLEVIRARYGKVAHMWYFVFGIMT